MKWGRKMPRYNCHDWNIKGKTAKRAFREVVAKLRGIPISSTDREAAQRKTDEQFPGF